MKSARLFLPICISLILLAGCATRKDEGSSDFPKVPDLEYVQ